MFICDAIEKAAALGYSAFEGDADLVQIKKRKVREAVLSSAFENLHKHGYAGTTMAAVARDAGISTATIYVYFSSKLELLQTVIRHWLLQRFDEMEAQIRTISEPRERTRKVLTFLWDDLPSADGNFAMNLLQGLALAEDSDIYSRELLRYFEGRVTKMLGETLPEQQRLRLGKRDEFALLAMMAFDGFVANQRVYGRSVRLESLVDLITDLLHAENASPLST